MRHSGKCPRPLCLSTLLASSPASTPASTTGESCSTILQEMPSITPHTLPSWRVSSPPARETTSFIIVADLREERADIKRLLWYWLSFIKHQKFSERQPFLLLVGSHTDGMAEKQVKDSVRELENFCMSIEPGQGISNKVEYLVGDCRDPKGRHISAIRSQIASLTKDSPHHQLSLHASILLGLLEKDFSQEPAFPITALQAHIEATGIGLPREMQALHSMLAELHEIGVLFVVKDSHGDPLQVIFNISKLTNEAHKLLFSRDAMARLREMCLESEGSNSSLNIGVLPDTVLQRVLPENISKECLVQLQYCQQIKHRDVGAFPSLPQSTHSDQSFLFFPALCSADKSKVSWVTPAQLSYSVGWLARCSGSGDYFPPRFLHVLLLRLVFRFTLSAPTPEPAPEACAQHSMFQRRCTMWKTGVHWLMEEGVECLVELVSGSKAVVVAVKSLKNREDYCVSIFRSIVGCVLEAKTEFCHSIKLDCYLLDSIQEADYLCEDNLFAMCEVERVLTHSKEVVVSVTGRKQMERSRLLCMHKLTLWNTLFPLDFHTVLDYLGGVVRDLYNLGRHLGLDEGVLDGIEEDFAGKVERRRREVVRVWMNSCPDPPCWWHLVQALRKIHENVLAEKIVSEHSKFESLV